MVSTALATKVSVESPRGEFSVWVSKNKKDDPVDIKILPPSTGALSLVPKILKNNYFADYPLILLGLDINISEVDL